MDLRLCNAAAATLLLLMTEMWKNAVNEHIRVNVKSGRYYRLTYKEVVSFAGILSVNGEVFFKKIGTITRTLYKSS